MAEDVLEKISSILGRKVEPVKAAAPAQPSASVKPVNQSAQFESPAEKILGRSLQPVKLPDMAASRFGMYSKARGNGFDQKKAAGVAMSQAGVMGKSAEPTTWESFKTSISKVPVNYGRTLGDVGEDLSRVSQRANNPFMMSDEQWEKQKQAHTEFFERHMGKGFVAGASQGALEFGEEMLSPVQVALAIGTFGESALARAAYMTGIKGAVPAARVVAKLIQTQFAAQMIEGTASGIEGTVKSAMNGDWESAGKMAVEALASGLMAKGIIHHEDAVGRVRQDLEKVAREKYGVADTGIFTNRFDTLDPYRQGEVIDETVKRSPEYQATVQQAEGQDAQARERTKKQQTGRLKNYYGQAMAQAWNPNVAQRTIRNLHDARVRGEKMDIKKAIQAHLERQQEISRQLVEEQRQQERQAARNQRGQKRQETAEQRSDLSDRAKGIAAVRQDLNAQREKGNEPPIEGALPQRHVEAVVDDNGQITYPADVWGETSHFGVAAGEGGHAIYRMTPRGVEWMDANGNFAAEPESLFHAKDPETADTMARVASLGAHADFAAEDENATEEQKHEADVLSGIRRDLVEGGLSARDAQRKAGIAEKVKLGDQFDAARDGKLNGPYHESSPSEFHEQLEAELRQDPEATDEDVQELLKNAGALAREQIESNLHHVYRPGDYIVSKRGVTWTLDSKGVLHPSDGGTPIPLLKKGIYSNQSLQLAASGRVGYGTRTRAQRRADNARRAEIQGGIRARQADIDREMRLAYQNVGLAAAPFGGERSDEDEKHERRAKFMSRPPVAPEVAESRQKRRMEYKSSNDPDSVINHLAKQYGVTPDEVMRIALSGREPQTTEAMIADLEVGDRISDPIRKDRPWMVEERGGKMWLRSGQASPLPLDRLNPSDRVRQIVERGEVTRDSHEWTQEEKQTAAFEKAYKVHQKFLVEGVRDRMEGKVKDPEPKTPEQAQEQSEAADRREAAAESVATEATIDALNPTTTDPEKAENDVKKAEEDVKVAEEAAAQAAESAAKVVPPDPFPQRAPASIGYTGSAGTIVQNNREFQFHYELLPVDGVQTSHAWNGVRMEVNSDFPEPLQPRTISDDEAKQNDQRATLENYDFRQYGDKTINASMGPTIVDRGARAVGGNTRLAILRRHLEYIETIRDPKEKAARLAGLKAAMRQLAQESGISGYPDDERMYVVVRMLDKPIETIREASELGRLFNKSVSVQITKAAKGISYSKSLTEPLLEEIGKRIESADGVIPAMNADPEFFRQLVIDKFGVTPEEYADWFDASDPAKGLVLHKNGQDQFVKALLGTVIKDTSILNRIEGKTAYRALERSLQYVLKMRAFPQLDITDKVVEAIHASADTQGTDVEKHSSKDPWRATFQPQQQQLGGMETDIPPEPDRVVETLWRALHASDAAVPRTFNDRLKSFIDDESSQESMFGPAEPETPVEAFNRAFRKELRGTALARGDKKEELSEEEFNAALRNREFSDEERQEVEDLKTKAAAEPEPEPEPVQAAKGMPPPPKVETVATHETTPEEYAQYKKNLAARGITPETAGDKWGDHIAEEEAKLLNAGSAGTIEAQDVVSKKKGKVVRTLQSQWADHLVQVAELSDGKYIVQEVDPEKRVVLAQEAKIFDSIDKAIKAAEGWTREPQPHVPRSKTPPADPQWTRYVEEKKPFMQPKPKNGIQVAPTKHPMTYLSGHHNAQLAETAKKRGDVGLLVTPLLPSYLKHSKDYPVIAVDNGVFSKSQPFDPVKFRALVNSVAADPAAAKKVRFVVAPDVVGNAAETLAKFDEWADEIHAKGLPVALAGQDGLENMLDKVPWDKVDVLFLGGSTDWKLGVGAKPAWYQMFREAEKRGIPVHMGRVNSGERINIAEYGLNATSADGTFLAFGPDKNHAKVEEWLNTQNRRTDIAGGQREPVKQDDTVPWSARPDEEDLDNARHEAEQPLNMFEPPPAAKSAERQLADDKKTQGYVTPNQLLDFLQHHPGTQEHAHELMRTAKMMAEYVFDDDRPDGVDRKDALGWILKERVAGIEHGQAKTKRGEYNDPMVERGIGSSILRLHQAADPTTFIHEFAHVIFPFLSNTHLKDIDTIGGMGHSVWDGKVGSLKGETYAKVSEKLAHGLEKFLRDENPAGFTSEVKALLTKLKSVMRKVYLAFVNDPLSEYENTDRSRAMFAKMFHISEFDVADSWRQEKAKARKAEKSLPKPEDAPHPAVSLAKKLGAQGIQESMNGHVEDSAGERVDPLKPTVVLMYDSLENAVTNFARLSDEESKIPGVDLIKGEDGKFGLRFNIKAKLPSELNQMRFGDQSTLYQDRGENISPDDPLSREERSARFREDVRENQRRTAEQLEPYRAAERQAIQELGENATPAAVANRIFQLSGMENPLDKLYGHNRKSTPGQGTLFQSLPERHPGLKLEDMESRLKAMPAHMMMQRKLLELQIKNLKNEIRSNHGIEEHKPESSPEIAKAALKEIKDAREQTTDRNGKGHDDVSGLPQPPRVGGIPKPPKLGMSNDAATGGKRVGAVPKSVARPPASLREVTPVSLQPIAKPRGEPVGTIKGEPFEEKAWREGLKRAGLPETLPAPTVALSRETAEKLKFPGQKQSVQAALSALEQGDGVVLGNATGSGKTYLATGLIKEFQNIDPNARILYITKNAKLKAKAASVADGTFGFKIDTEKPKDVAVTGVYAASYMGMVQDSIYSDIKWDLVVADESGEARNWFKPENQQGKLLMKVIANAQKAVYMSATPFHSPSEYGYLEKLNLWPQGQFDKWIQQNFEHQDVDGKIVARLDPGKQAKLRQQLIERGQFVSQAISYDGFNAHFGVVPVTDSMRRGLDRIREGISRARAEFLRRGKKGLSEKVSAFEATYTKAFLERERLPQAIELARKAREQGWQVVIFSEHSSEDLFRRERDETKKASTYQELDDAMGGQLSRIIPPFPSVYNKLREEFGAKIGDYSGRGNNLPEREKAVNEFLAGQTPMLYTTYAAGGIGVDMHDADFPDLGIKGGDKPRISIFLGPPYSGVLLEQAMGRTWRFGVKSDTISVFLASDSEPDVKLMTTKVGPRMRALRAAVLGEQDSLAGAMSAYSDEEKVRARQDALAYAEGNEQRVTANDFNVRSKKRDVGIQEWSSIKFPSAETAKNKGMKYGEEVPGGDWSTLYQDKFKQWEDGPPSKEKIQAEAGANEVAQSASRNPEIPRQVLGMGAAQAVTVADNAPEGTDRKSAGRMMMQGHLNAEGFFQDPATGGWTAPHALVKEMLGDDVSGIDERELKHYPRTTLGMNFEQRAIAAGRKIGAERQVRDVLNRIRGYFEKLGGVKGTLQSDLADIHRMTGLDLHDEKTMREVWDVKEGRKASADPKINQAAELLRVWTAHARSLMEKGMVPFTMDDGRTGTYAAIQENPTYMPHITDWNMKLTDSVTGKTKTLKEITDDRTLNESAKLRYLEAKRIELGESEQTARQWLEDLKRDRTDRLRGPRNGNVTIRRKMNHPFYRKDLLALMSYTDQVASAVSLEHNFGTDMGKLRKDVASVPNNMLRTDILSGVGTIFEHPDWTTFIGQVVRHGQGLEALTKMTLSPISAMFHGIHATMGLGGRLAPLAKSALRFASHPQEMMREKYYIGVVSSRLNPWLVEGGKRGLANTFFEWSGFNDIYKMTRAIVGDSARVWMDQNALADLRAGGGREIEARRLLKDSMLIGDHSIDQAIATGQWSQDNIETAQRAFTDLVAFSENPMQMPKMARLSMGDGLTNAEKNLHAAARGSYMLQSFSIKTYSLLKEKLFDEVVRNGNMKPLAPFLLLYPAAGLVLAGLKAGSKGGMHRVSEAATGKKHEHDAWDTFLDQFKDVAKHPWVGPLKLYLDSLATAAAMERVKRWGDTAMMLSMGENRKSANMVGYMAEDELEQSVGGLFSDIFEVFASQFHLAKDELQTKKDNKRWGIFWRDEAREFEQVLPISRVESFVDRMAHPPKQSTSHAARF